MISIYDTIAIPAIMCLCVSLFIVKLYKTYWKNHKISIFGAMGAATFVWVTYMNTLLPTTTIFVFAIVMVIAISICDALYIVERRNVKACEEEV